MNEKRFHELLNDYLDGELSGADLHEFKQALKDSPRYRGLLQQYQRLQVAQVAAVKRRPSLEFGSLFPFGRICRSGALLMNSCVLLLSVGLFQIGGPLNTDAPSTSSFSTTSSLSVPTGKEEGKALLQPTLRAASDTGPSLSVADVFGPGPSVQVAEQPATNSGDNFGSLIAEEYGFVRL